MNNIVITDTKMRRLVASICRDITLSDWRPDYIVGITRGGLVPAVMLSHYFDVPMHALNLSLKDPESGPESNLWMADDANEGKQILVVDDINDTGATFNWLMNDWPASCSPYGNPSNWEHIWQNNVRFAVLVDNLSSQCAVGMYYCGMEINKEEEDVGVEFPYETWWK